LVLPSLRRRWVAAGERTMLIVNSTECINIHPPATYSTENICGVLKILAGNVLICHVFPSLHLQTCCVVSQHVADTSLVMLATWQHGMLARVSKRHNI
jgi:hypothetical protein